VIPYGVYRENEFEIENIKNELSKRLAWQTKINLLIELQKFTVPIATWAYDNARKRKNGEVTSTIRVDRYTEYPVVTYQYTEEFGLIFANDVDAFFQ